MQLHLWMVTEKIPKGWNLSWVNELKGGLLLDEVNASGGKSLLALRASPASELPQPPAQLPSPPARLRHFPEAGEAAAGGPLWAAAATSQVRCAGQTSGLEGAAEAAAMAQELAAASLPPGGSSEALQSPGLAGSSRSP